MDNGGKIIDFEEMAIAWCDDVDGEKINPKLPVYLRTHYNKWIQDLLPVMQPMQLLAPVATMIPPQMHLL